MDPIKALEEAGTAPVSDALSRQPGISGVRPVSIGKPVAGPAFTVRTTRSNWLPVARAVEEAPQGSVIVVYDEEPLGAIWGELMTRSAMARGVKAALVYGYTRDTMEIRELGFPLYSLGTTPRAGAPGEGGELGVELTLPGGRVRPGDVVVMDQDGVIVVPGEKLEEIVDATRRILDLEARIRAKIQDGKGLYTILLEEGLLGKVG